VHIKGKGFGGGRLWHYVLMIKRIYNMDLALILFGLGSIGFIFNRNNLILMIMSIEIILLSVGIMFLCYSLQFDDMSGEVFALYIIAIAGAESAIGLAILIAYFRLRKG